MARGRGTLTPQDKMHMKTIAKNIAELLQERALRQIDLSKGTNIPPSTLTGYIKGTSLPIPGNIEKIATFFNVPKSTIDPRFISPSNLTPPNFDPNKTTEPCLKENTTTHNQEGYYIDPEVAEYADKLKNNPDMRLLFDAAEDMTKDDIDFVVNMIEGLKKREGK